MNEMTPAKKVTWNISFISQLLPRSKQTDLDFFLLLAIAGSDHADPGLPLQLAALVVVGDTG